MKIQGVSLHWVALLAIITGALAATENAAWAGPYSPASDEPGSTGISANDPRILGWATEVVEIHRGPVDITIPTGAKATYGTADKALGPSDSYYNEPTYLPHLVSLGDGGSITLSFSIPIANGPGTDLAVFENAFKISSMPGYFLELAYVDVSSNGTDFFRFPSVSLSGTTTQIDNEENNGLDPTDIYNLAGKDISGYGTAFDLADLTSDDYLAAFPTVSALLDLNNIKYVRITDVIGSLNPAYANYDFKGNIINDPWKTNFNTGGFDLDAIAVLHTIPEPDAGCLFLLGLSALAWLRGKQAARPA